MTIKRIWHGWTTPENADAYENLLYRSVFPEIEAKKISGYRGIELLRRKIPGEVEFITIMKFDSIDNIIEFQGEDYQRCYVPAEAQKLLKRWDKVSAHYEIRDTRNYG